MRGTGEKKIRYYLLNLPLFLAQWGKFVSILYNADTEPLPCHDRRSFPASLSKLLESVTTVGEREHSDGPSEIDVQSHALTLA